MPADFKLDKNNIDFFFKELAKEYRKASKIPIEIVIVGGASIFINYSFRVMSLDIDCLMSPESKIFKETIIKIADKYNVPYGWLNDDFTKTKSYSPRLRLYSEYYKTFSNIVEVRYIKGEYLIATKIMSGRMYKNDLSDIVGILNDELQDGNPIDLNQIKKAIVDIYGEEALESIDNSILNSVAEIMSKKNYQEIYNEVRNREIAIRKTLIEIEKTKPKSISEDNVNEIIKIINNRKQ